MKRINSPTGRFENANREDRTEATRITADWLNSIQDELVTVIEKLGRMKLDENDNTQLLQAITHYFKNGSYPHVSTHQVPSLEPVPIGLKLDTADLDWCIFGGVLQHIETNLPLEPFELMCIRISGGWETTLRPFDSKKTLSFSMQVSPSNEVTFKTESNVPGHAIRLQMTLIRQVLNEKH